MEIPIFPLNGAVLFPKTNLPLNIFEERYIDMVDYALSKKRLIGMIQKKSNGRFYNIGCLGKITSFNETNDGRYLINLEGLNLFVLKKEKEKKHKFRIVEIDVLYNKDKGNYKLKEENKNKILNLYNDYIKEKKININLKELKDIELDQLARFIAMVSPFDNVDKQMLLEIIDAEEFVEKLVSIIEIEMANNNYKKVFN